MDWVYGRLVFGRHLREEPITDNDPEISDIYPLSPRYSGDQSSQITIIPGDKKAACNAVVLTLVYGGFQPTPTSVVDGLLEHNRMVQAHRRSVFRSLKAHLIKCGEIVKFVLVVLDHWDGPTFEREHVAELAAWRERGVRFLFLLVTRERSLSPIAVELRWAGGGLFS